MVLLAYFVGCKDGIDDPMDLEGEWTIEITWTGALATASKNPAEGVVVLNRALPRYSDEEAITGSMTVAGRAYIKFREPPAREGKSPSRFSFEAGLGADRLEVVHAKFTAPDSVEIELAPLVNDFDPVLRGELSDAEIRGDVVMLGGMSEHPLMGTFVMRRRKASIYSDSAMIRSIRGTAEWNQ